MIQYSDILAAAERIRPYVHHTPVMSSATLDALTGAHLFFKCENFQRGGAFKARGAHNAVFALTDAQAAQGIVTHSSGNHGAAVALAARNRGTRATVIMPRNVALPKKTAVLAYGARVLECEPTLTARQAATADLLAREGGVLVHPYDDYAVMAGQGTAMLELVEQVAGLDLVLTPVGGGGLLAGTAVVTRTMLPHARIVGVEPELADDAHRSFHGGSRVTIDSSPTIADGLRGSLGERTYPVVRDHVDDIVTVGEAAIIQAMRTVWERMKIIIEPSSAVPLAALLSGKLAAPGQRVGIILSGGNVDLERLPWKREA